MYRPVHCVYMRSEGGGDDFSESTIGHENRVSGLGDVIGLVGTH